MYALTLIDIFFQISDIESGWMPLKILALKILMVACPSWDQHHSIINGEGSRDPTHPEEHLIVAGSVG